jgi:hypothetical protein
MPGVGDAAQDDAASRELTDHRHKLTGMEKFVTGSELRVRVAVAEYWHEIGLSDDRVIR